MDKELEKDVEFVAAVLKEFVIKHNLGYIAASALDGSISIHNCEPETPKVSYFRNMKDIKG